MSDIELDHIGISGKGATATALVHFKNADADLLFFSQEGYDQGGQREHLFVTNLFDTRGNGASSYARLNELKASVAKACADGQKVDVKPDEYNLNIPRVRGVNLREPEKSLPNDKSPVIKALCTTAMKP